MQKCPLCGRMNRMVVRGVYICNGKREQYPDIGYSFCNCKNLFYTNYENVKVHNIAGFQYYEHPLEELKNVFDAMPKGNTLTFSMPDPFFVEWDIDPYEFEHWNPRMNHVIFDIGQLVEECKAVGFEVISVKKNFELDSPNPKTTEISIRKP